MADIWDELNANWKQFKGEAKKQWGKLTDDEVTQMEGKKEKMVGKIQEKYNITEDKARQQVDEWANDLRA